jgi:hypothetical protein
VDSLQYLQALSENERDPANRSIADVGQWHN